MKSAQFPINSRGLRMAMVMTTALVSTPTLIQSAYAESTEVIVQTAQAIEQIRFSIDEQSLADALVKFGQQSGVQVSVDSDRVTGLRTKGVIGVMSKESALIELLSGTGLNYRTTSNGNIIIDETLNSDDASVTITTPVMVQAESDDTLIQDGYVALVSTIGTKKDTPLVEVPQNISVVTEGQMDERAPRTINEAMAYVPGVNNSSYGFDTRYDAFFIRGFDGAYNAVFRDGLRQYGGSSALYKSEPYGLEGIEILKGPSSALYGASSSGGLANQVTKRPTEDPLREVEFLVGSHNRAQASFDVSDSLTEEGEVKFRVTGLTRDADTELTDYADDRDYIAPTISFEITDDTKITLLSEYMKSLTGGTAAYYNENGRITDLYGGEDGYNDFNQRQYRLGYELEHRFNDMFTLRQNVRYTDIDIDLEYAYWYDNSGTLARAAGRALETQHALVADTHLVSKVATGNIRHTVTSGLDYGKSRYAQDLVRFAAIPTFGSTVDMTNATKERQKQEQVGVYVHDQMELNDWRFTLGGRYDRLDSTTHNSTAETKQDDSEFSHQLGLSYVFESGFVPFANYSTSFTPNTGTLIDGSAASPTTGEQIEVGLKYEFPDRNAMITTSLFHIDQEDGVVFDSASGINRQVQQDMRSQGFEIEAVASLVEGWSVNASYAYTDTEIQNGAQGTSGKQVSGVPEHTFSLYNDYTFQKTALRGFGAGAGIRFFGESFGNDTNTFENSSRYFVDAAVHYDLGEANKEMEGMKVQLNVTNLFDQTREICKAGYCYRDEGMNVMASMRYRF
ncbi:TonB-dependent siderophore receptor [Curvivirga sp.]|uniref:TonB-dependent siderophore receptor n=1 Tax=Curvivirga sp. TaxID=2856848 RepID=UPI003B5C43AE